MKRPDTTSACYLEIGQGSLRALHNEDGLELPLERLPNGRLTANCKQNLTLSLEGFFRRKSWQPRAHVFCAIPARGVSLRRMVLPPTTRESLKRVLLLQLENEFPVPPDDLAWGYRPLGEDKAPGNGSSGQQQLLVAAVKKEVIDEYSEVLGACGVVPQFTLAALARQAICPPTPNTHSILDIGRYSSELISFENGVATTVRMVSWGGESITHALQHKLGISHDEAEKLKVQLGRSTPSQEQVGSEARAALEEALDSLAKAINGHAAGEKIYLTGRTARLSAVADGLSRKLASAVRCEALEPEPVAGRSAAILGLRTLVQHGDAGSLLSIRPTPTNGSTGLSQPAPWKWVGLAAALALMLALLPYAEALALKPYLTNKLAAIKADKGRLAMIDNEFGFLQYLKQNQPPYLDAIYILAKAAPPGAKLESISMNRRGDVSLRASMQNSQQVTDFRSKLIDSGFFENVALEEQAPVMNQPKLNVRMSAQWKPLSARQALSLGPTADEIEKAKTKPRNQQPGMPPMMGMPTPMPMPMPGPPGMPGPAAARRARLENPPGAGPPPGALPPGVVIPGNP